MNHWERIRVAAAGLRNELSSKTDGERTPEQLCESAASHLGLALLPEHPDSAHLHGAQAVLEDDIVFFNNTLTGWRRAFTIAHEIGHKFLRHDRAHCSAESIEERGAAEDSDSSAERAVGYGAAERREREANLFALEFLLPCEELRQAFRDGGEHSLASEVPFETYVGQLLRAVLVPESAERKNDRPATVPDDSQAGAARHLGSPLLVSAGPGTGKTQTLAERITFLLGKRVRPERILALTFSNKAAEEMRERVAEKHPDEATAIEMMTFHAFGLNLLRRYWKRAGLDPHAPLIDKIEALMHLERHLAELDLDRFFSLSEPTRYLPQILAAVSRAKDELCGPERFAELAEAQLEKATESGDEKEIAKAEKAVEAARVYTFYQEWLTGEGALDFGDLIFRSVELLRNDEAVRKAVTDSYDAILVDEFQDVNRASGLLLKEIAGDGSGLWAVGDIRQSIYRWRGASPSNIGSFNEDYPGAETKPLNVNYRSVAGIVGAFSEFAATMIAGAGGFCDWSPIRGDGDEAIGLTVAPDLASEAAAIAREAKARKAAGTPWSDMAVICRTHRQLVNFSEAISAQGVPVFYLGDVFERHEIRDLLSLLELAVRNHGHSLVRVARIPEYSIPEADVTKVIEAARRHEGGFAAVLADADFDRELSERGVPGWQLLRKHLGALNGAPSAWVFLARYLFEISRFLDTYFVDDDAARMTARIAIYQFGRFAESMAMRIEETGPAAIDRFLRYVRRLAWFREDKDLAQIPEAAAGLDAVRFLTVHGAKGTEFDTVFLPYLGAGKFPHGRSGSQLPIPHGLIEGDPDYHREEEECLFFVGLSRARDHLRLSRAESYGKSKSNPSEFLERIAVRLPVAEHVPPVDAPDAGPGEPGLLRDVFWAAELDRYIRCGREHYYTAKRRLKSREDMAAYRELHVLIRESIREAANDPGTTPAEVFRRKWDESEVGNHSLSGIYRKVAEEILARPEALLTAADGHEFAVGVRNGTVRISADEVNEQGNRVVVRRVKTGRKPSKVRDDFDAFLHLGAAARFPGREIEVRKTFLLSGDDVEIEMTDVYTRNAVNRYQDAIDGINAGLFPTASNEESCPNCPHYFICPAGD